MAFIRPLGVVARETHPRYDSRMADAPPSARALEKLLEALDPVHPASEFVRAHKQRFGEFLLGLDRLQFAAVHP
jgi:hypothetical protein